MAAILTLWIIRCNGKKIRSWCWRHPGFQDLAGFGRRNIDMEREDLMNLIIYQIGALDIFCQKHGVPLRHVKPHGNMNNMADSDEQMATNIVDAVLAVRPDLPVMVEAKFPVTFGRKEERIAVHLGVVCRSFLP